MQALAPNTLSPWLSLGEASRLLGITPGTLRRWADQGDVAAFVTPGGHRRFPRAAIESLMPHPRSRRPLLTGLGTSASRVARAYLRTQQTGHRANPPAAALSEAERAELGERGRRLLLLLLDHLNEDAPASSGRLVEAEEQATAYGARAADLGVSLSMTLEAFVRFRGAFIGELAAMARRRRLDTREATVLLVEGERAVDRLLMALTDGYVAVRA